VNAFEINVVLTFVSFVLSVLFVSWARRGPRHWLYLVPHLGRWLAEREIRRGDQQ
jgi:uncharacterized membrane protein